VPRRPKPKAKPQKAPRHRKRPHPLAKAIGQRVNALRDSQGYSYDAFVEEVGLGRGYISELERGLVLPTVASLAAIAGALEVTIADLVLGDTLREQLFAATGLLEPAQLRELLVAARRLAAANESSERE
jgi:transcriptional regulator with XRE-family HTH domain